MGPPARLRPAAANDDLSLTSTAPTVGLGPGAAEPVPAEPKASRMKRVSSALPVGSATFNVFNSKLAGDGSRYTKVRNHTEHQC
jgi:hypothetical protein